MKLNASDFSFPRPATKVDEEEKQRINEAIGIVVGRMMDVAEEHHTRDSVIYIESAEKVALLVLDLPTPGYAAHVAAALEKDKSLSQLIDQAKASGFAPQGELPNQPSPEPKQPANNTAVQLEEAQGILRTSERFRGELLTAAGLPLSDPGDGRAHHEAVRAIQALRADAGPRATAQADPKDSPEYKDLKARLEAAEAANETLKNEKQALQDQIDHTGQALVSRSMVAGLASKLQPLEAGRFGRLSDEDKASETARKALVELGKTPASNQQRPTRQPRRTA